jgi:alkylation response protein AidB-like acyl-CoA dehydrogenase
MSSAETNSGVGIGVAVGRGLGRGVAVSSGSPAGVAEAPLASGLGETAVSESPPQATRTDTSTNETSPKARISKTLRRSIYLSPPGAAALEGPMDFRFSPEDEAFRSEIRSFVGRELPSDWATATGAGGLGEGDEERWDFLRQFQRKLAAKGWLTLGWPKEHGGMAAGHITQAIYNEEMAYHRAPTQLGVGPDRVGPTIILYGTDDQKRDHLPGIVDAETVWCQGFSEPEAGSDLASLQTKAVQDGDSFVINGQKIWTSLAHQAGWCILLARTDPDAPKHKGISYFALDMRSPGVEVRPLIDIMNRHTFNEVFFDNVRVPRDCLIGELNRGWYVAAATLDFERSGINRVVAGFRTYQDLVAYARDRQPDGHRPVDDSRIAMKLADLAIEFEAGRLLAYRVAWMQSSGQIPNAEASMSKLFGSELQCRLATAGLEVLGLGGQLTPDSPQAALAGRLEQYYLYAAGLTIAAGTSEIQRNIIAGRGLGLPRG